MADRPTDRLVSGFDHSAHAGRVWPRQPIADDRGTLDSVLPMCAVPSPCHACRTNTPHHTGPTRSERGGACAHHRALNGEADEVGSCTAWPMASQAKPACVLRPPPGGWAVRVLRPSGLCACLDSSAVCAAGVGHARARRVQVVLEVEGLFRPWPVRTLHYSKLSAGRKRTIDKVKCKRTLGRTLVESGNRERQPQNHVNVAIDCNRVCRRI